MSKLQCELGIAQITGDTETVKRIEREMERERRWREDTPEGWVETLFEGVGPGYANMVSVPNHLEFDKVFMCVKRHFKKKGVKLEIEDYGNNRFWYETLY